MISHHPENNTQFSLSMQIIPVKSSSTSTAADGCHLVFPCARAQRILVVVSDWLTFDSAAGTCCITVHTKFHAILARFLSPRRVPSISFSWNLCDMSPAGTKYHPSISLHEGESRCNISLGHVPANVVSFVPSAWNNRSYRIRERIKRQVEKKYRTTHLLTHCQHFASLTYDFAQRRHHTGHDLITTIWQSIWQGAGLRFSPRVLAPAQVNKSLLLYGSVSQGLGTTKFTNLIG